MKYLSDIQWASTDGSVHRFKEIYQLMVDEPVDYGTAVAYLTAPAWTPADIIDYNLYTNNWTYLTADRLLFLIRLITNSIGDGESENAPTYAEMHPNCLTYPEWYYSDGKHSFDDVLSVPNPFPFHKSYVDLLTSLFRTLEICVSDGLLMKLSNFNDAVTGDGFFDLIIPASYNATVLSGFSESTAGWNGQRVDNIWVSAKFGSISANALQTIEANSSSGVTARSLAPTKRFCHPMQNQVLYNPMGEGSLSGLWGLQQLQINRATNIASLFTLKEDKSYDWTDGYGSTYTMIEVRAGAGGRTYFVPSTLTEIVINSVSETTLAYEQQSIIGSQFYGMTMLQSVQVGSGYSTVGSYAFAGCSALSSVAFSDGLLTIGQNAFANCTALTDKSLKFPDGVTTVEQNAFQNCSALTEFDWHFQASSINAYTFEGCVNLAKLHLSSSVTFIATNALDGCRKLSDIYYNGIKADWDNNVTKPGEGAWPSVGIVLTLHCTDGDYELQHPIE